MYRILVLRCTRFRTGSEPGEWQSKPDVHVIVNDDDWQASSGEFLAFDKPSTWDDAAQHRGEGGHSRSKYLDPASSTEVDTRARIDEIIRNEDDSRQASPASSGA